MLHLFRLNSSITFSYRLCNRANDSFRIKNAQEETAFLNKQLHEQSYLISQTISDVEQNGKRKSSFIHIHIYKLSIDPRVIKIVGRGVSHIYKNIKNYSVNTTNILPKQYYNHCYTRRIHLHSKTSVCRYFLMAALNFALSFFRIVTLGCKL